MDRVVMLCRRDAVQPAVAVERCSFEETHHATLFAPNFEWT